MHYFNCIWQGILAGASLSLMLGTIFFSLLRNSIQHGYKTGFYIAAGVVGCDVLYVLVSLLSQDLVSLLKVYKMQISIIGGSVLIVSGIIMLIKSKPQVKEGKLLETHTKSNLYFFFNGFLLNLLNPINFFSIFGISVILTTEFNYNIKSQIVFFTACLSSVFLVEVLISYTANKIKKWITPLILRRINQVSGIVFIIIGAKLVFGIEI